MRIFYMTSQSLDLFQTLCFVVIISVRLVSGRTSVRYRFGSPFSSKRLWFLDTVLWLCPSLPTETLKWLSSLPILMQESFWWWQSSDRYIISLFPHFHTLPPFSPSLISLVVSVDVKHHVYWLTRTEDCHARQDHSLRKLPLQFSSQKEEGSRGPMEQRSKNSCDATVDNLLKTTCS